MKARFGPNTNLNPKFESGVQCTAEIREGETVLVTAAAGGTGHLGVQLALLKGCRVVATCGSAEKAQKLRDLGVHRVINYHEEVSNEASSRDQMSVIWPHNKSHTMPASCQESEVCGMLVW